MRRLYSLLIALLVCGSAMSQNLAIDFGTKGEKQILENNDQNLKMRYSFKGISTFKVKTEKGEFNEIAIPGAYHVGDIGTPKLPAAKDLIEIPFGAEVSVEVINYDVQKYNMKDYGILNQVIPQQLALSKSEDSENAEFNYNDAAYASKQMEGYELATVKTLGTLRGMRLARLEVRPVKYNASTNEIEVYNNVEVKVVFKNADIQKTTDIKTATQSIFFEPVYNTIINRSSVDDYPDHPDLVQDKIKMLVVSDRMFEDQLQPFFEWKTKCGYELVVAYTDEIGGTYNEVETWIHDQYDQGVTDGFAPSFLLLVGDSEQIPMKMGGSSGKYTDLYYGSVDGDIFPEMYYARFSAENEEDLQPQIDKTLYYEQYQFEDPSFLDRVTLIAGADGNWNPKVGQPTVKYGTQNYFNEAHGYTEVNDYLTSYAGCYDHIDEGLGFINYTAHCNEGGWGDPSLSIADVNNLNNDKMYPLAVGNCCLSNNIGYGSECVGETWMRKANGGAVNYIGSAPSSYWFEDFYWGVGAFELQGTNDGYVPTVEETTLGVYDAMWMGGYYCVDAMIFVGNLAVTEVDNNSWPQHSSPTYYWEAYMCNGDPSNIIYHTQGTELEVDHMDIMPIGADFYEINTIPGAYVGISKDGVLHGAGHTNVDGYISVELTPILSGGDVDIVVTAPQKIPYITTVPAAALEGPYVIMEECIFDDENGNNNQIIEYTEIFTADITLKNVGADKATNIVATLTGEDDYVVLSSENTLDFGDINNDESATIEEAFTFNVATYVPNGHIATFTLTMTDGTDTWESDLKVNVSAPSFAIGDLGIDDTQAGNSNGYIDAGEEITISIPATNDGDSDALTSVGRIISNSPYLAFANLEADLETLEIDETVSSDFQVTVSADAPVGSIINFEYEVQSRAYFEKKEFTILVGFITEDWETGDMTQYNWETGGDAEWTVQGDVVYEGDYAIASGDIGDNNSSEYTLTTNVLVDDVVSFYYKVSSEESYDKLHFYIDGSEKGVWSGDIDWTFAEYEITAGEHTLKWEYTKDVSDENGQDKAWVDNIKLPAMVGNQSLALFLNSDSQMHCLGQETQLFANASGGTGSYEYTWTANETLSATDIFNPIATPDVETTYTCTVSDGETEVSAEFTLSVTDAPEVLSISIDGTSLVASSATAYQWYDSYGPIFGATEQTYTPDHTASYWCVAVNENGCESNPSNVIWFGPTEIDENVKETSLHIFPNPAENNKTNIQLTLKDSEAVKISIYNTIGTLVKVVEDSNNKLANSYEYSLHVDNFNKGVYIVVLETKTTKIASKLVIN